VSEYLIGTSEQYRLECYSCRGKYGTEDKSRSETPKTKHNPEKANNTKYSRTKLDWFSSVLSYDTRPGNEE